MSFYIKIWHPVCIENTWCKSLPLNVDDAVADQCPLMIMILPRIICNNKQAILAQIPYTFNAGGYYIAAQFCVIKLLCYMESKLPIKMPVSNSRYYIRLGYDSWRVPPVLTFAANTRHVTYRGTHNPHSLCIPLVKSKFHLNSFCPWTATLWNILPTGCFSFTTILMSSRLGLTVISPT